MTGMAGVTGLEPAASGVTGQRSNQLSYTPVKKGKRAYHPPGGLQAPTAKKAIRTTDAKEVGVGNPAEETCRCPDRLDMLCLLVDYVNLQI